jgi:hypothetical protein
MKSKSYAFTAQSGVTFPRRKGDSPIFAANKHFYSIISFAPRKSGQSPAPRSPFGGNDRGTPKNKKMWNNLKMTPKKPFDAGPPSAKIRPEKCANSRENGILRSPRFRRMQESAGNPTRYVLEKLAEIAKKP